jgi:hypothetical protein
MGYSNLGKIFISRYILQHWYTCPVALPVRRNPQHRSLLTVVSHFHNWPGIIYDFQTSLRDFVNPVVKRFTQQTLPTVNRKYFFMNNLCIGSFWPQKSSQENAALRYYTSPAFLPFWLLIPASEHAHARLLPILPWSWTVLLTLLLTHAPTSDINRKLSTYLEAVLLQFVTHLLNLTRNFEFQSPDWGFPWFCRVPLGKYEGSISIRQGSLPYKYLILCTCHLHRHNATY